MPRPQLITRPVKLTIHLPEDTALWLALFLTSPALGRIPQGAYQEFFVERINEFRAKLANTLETHVVYSLAKTANSEGDLYEQITGHRSEVLDNPKES